MVMKGRRTKIKTVPKPVNQGAKLENIQNKDFRKKSQNKNRPNVSLNNKK